MGDEDAFLYFLQSERGKRLIKIGTTRGDVAVRIKDLRRASPVPLRLLGLTPGGLDAERALHVEFAELRTYGEWFLPHRHLLQFILDLVTPEPTAVGGRGLRMRDGVRRPTALDGEILQLRELSEQLAAAGPDVEEEGEVPPCSND